MGLEQIANINISRNTQSISRAGFGTPLILGDSGDFTGVRVYTDLDGVADDFAETDAEFIMASKLFAQTPSPSKIKIAKRPDATTVAVALAGISDVDDDWYALLMTSKVEADVTAAATYIEGNRKIFATSLADAEIIDAAVTDDPFSALADQTLFRTITFFSANADEYPEAGFVGRFLPTEPGSEQWSMKPLAGVSVDELSPTAQTALKGKNVNFYTRIAGVGVSQEGKVAAGEWIDVIRFIDWLEARMQEEIFGSLVENEKIPYTNGGISILENDVAGVLRAGQKNGGIAPDDVDAETGKPVPGYVTMFPRVSEIAQADRAARVFTGGKFTAKLAGAIVAAEITGSVTV
jgi:Protein of unknown function (DUF3383)